MEEMDEGRDRDRTIERHKFISDWNDVSEPQFPPPIDDDVPRRHFDNFLDSCNIRKRKGYRRRSPSLFVNQRFYDWSLQDDGSSNNTDLELSSSEDLESDVEDDYGGYIDEHTVRLHSEGPYENTYTVEADEDTFYDSLPQPEVQNSDSNEYVREDYGSAVYERYSRSDEDDFKLPAILKKFQPPESNNIGEYGLPVNSDDTFLHYENHSPINKLLVPYSDFAKDDLNQPASKYPESLRLDKFSSFQLDCKPGRMFRNNLSVCSQRYNLMFVASMSRINVIKAREFSNNGNISSSFIIETKANSISEYQQEHSTFPGFPYLINYMMIGTFFGLEVLGVVTDDGRVLLYDTETFSEKWDWFVSQISDLRPVLTYRADVEVKVDCSAWGLDIYKNMLAVSDNSRRVTLFYYNESNVVYLVKTRPLFHNIPSISFIKNEKEVYISAGSISGEVVVFKFPMNIIHRISGGNLSTKVDFKKPEVVSRVATREEIWCVNFVDGDHFKSVDSFELLTGDPWIDKNGILASKILSESELLDAESNYCKSSHLGLSSEFQSFYIPTEAAQNFVIPTTETDRMRRIKKMYDDYYEDFQRGQRKKHISKRFDSYWQGIAHNKRFKNKFLLVTGKKQLSLFRVNRLLFNATVSDIFGFTTRDENEDSCNRLSLSLVIPELNCFIVASQVGLVSIFRLTKYRGIVGMRQEFVLPTTYRSGSLGHSSCKYLSGITCKKLCEGRFLLYFIFYDGLLVVYQLTDPLTSHHYLDYV